jgi:hypothetical protein
LARKPVIEGARVFGLMVFALFNVIKNEELESVAKHHSTYNHLKPYNTRAQAIEYQRKSQSNENVNPTISNIDNCCVMSSDIVMGGTVLPADVTM